MTEPVGVGGGPDATPNRLLGASSPYLRQHAYNPVDWYPWGEEAFEKARAEDRPIFLSIGYATCHWCHVMAHESFEDPAVASLLNDGFVSIKLDREERPDVDSVYMTVCQLMTGHGGWPLTVAMTPDRRPFFAGTYFPRESRHGRMGMLDLVPRLSALWNDRRSDLEASADAAVEAIRELEGRGGEEAGGGEGEETLKRGYEELRGRYDPQQGGFGRAPKFPTPHNLMFLLRWHDRTGEPAALEMVEKTLTMMRRGGVFDHIGSGFHRYSTDARWLLPHFEKMLYDQALIAMAATETWQVTRDDRYRRIVDEIFEYVSRDLTDETGGFCSAEDADSEGREGAFYVWTREEFDRVLEPSVGRDEAAFARDAFGVQNRGNFADEATGEMTGENIIHRRGSRADLAVRSGSTEAEVGDRLEAIRDALFEAREKRPRPLLDDKILTDWNGLMIAALASAGRAFGDRRYTVAAEAAARFILDRLAGDEGGLLHRYRAGTAGIRAGAADYAYLLWGLIELYGATFEPEWLERSGDLAVALMEEFWDHDRGGLFTSAADVDDVLVRQREIYDGATPSVNATARYALARLSQLTGNPEWASRSAAIGDAFAGVVERNPSAHTMSLVALDLALGPSHEVVIAGDRGATDTGVLLATIEGRFRPRTGVLLRPSGEGAKVLDRVAPFTRGQSPVGGAAAAYVCSEFACQRPTTDASEMVTLLD
ncbi:MAG: thioredoxin domain-containing protein [Gemmatimonadota bacterium]|nr:thioredoxin domain-containing protein [Gemmatimonadota bacterium]